MRYALLIYEKPGSHAAAIEEEGAEAVRDPYFELAADPRCLSSGQLQPLETATTLQLADGETVTTDGPFADTKEVFGGFYIFDVPDLAEALELAARIPAARLGGKVEIRPLVES